VFRGHDVSQDRLINWLSTEHICCFADLYKAHTHAHCFNSYFPVNAS